MTSDSGESQVKPYTEADFVGPEDRPRAPWELTMYNWRAVANTTVLAYMHQMDGTSIRAVQCAVRSDQGLIYVQACEPDCPKAHLVSLNPTHRSASFSLYTQLLPFHFPRVGKRYKAVFTCWPEQYGDEKVLVIQIKGYKIVRVDQEAAEAEEQAAGE